MIYETPVKLVQFWILKHELSHFQIEIDLFGLKMKVFLQLQLESTLNLLKLSTW